MSNSPPSAALSAALLLASTPAFAVCDVTLAQPPEAVAFTYDPFDLQAPVGPLRLALRNQGDARTLELILSGEDGAPLALAGPGDALPIDIDARDNVQPIAGTEGLHFLLEATPDTVETAVLDVEVAGAPVPPPGLYAGDLAIRVRDYASGEPCVERFRVRTQVQVPSRAQINIAGSSGPIGDDPGLSRIDFGTLESGEARTVFVQIRANGPTRLSLSSREGGRMRHVDLPEFAAPYAVDLLGQRLDLSGAVELAAPTASSVAGVALPMVVTVGEVGGLPSGAYEDLITIAISAL